MPFHRHPKGLNGTPENHHFSKNIYIIGGNNLTPIYGFKALTFKAEQSTVQ
jgi:hypothetical protein